jgi:hypothetical protein
MVGQSDWLPMMIVTGLVMRPLYGSPKEGADLSESAPARQVDTLR